MLKSQSAISWIVGGSWGIMVGMPRAALIALTMLAFVACSDDDPLIGDVNGDSDIVAVCDNDSDCDSGSTCCDGYCENTDLSVNACGGCGVVCADNRYCTGTSCADLSFASLCANTDIRTIHRGEKVIDDQVDNPDSDNAAADTIAAAFAELCQKSPFPISDESSVLTSPSSGPLNTARGTTLVVAGGRVYSYVIDWLDDANVTPVELVAPDGLNFQLVARSQRKVIVADAFANLNDDLDYVVGQAVYDATTGTQLLNIYGVFQPGTEAGAAYFADFIGETAAGSEHWFIAKLENGVVTRLAGE